MLRRGVRQADLLGKDRRAGARGSGEDDERARLEPAPEDDIEVGNPRFQPPHVKRPFSPMRWAAAILDEAALARVAERSAEWLGAHLMDLDVSMADQWQGKVAAHLG